MDRAAIAKVIRASEQYARYSDERRNHPSDEKINALIKGLKLGDLKADPR